MSIIVLSDYKTYAGISSPNKDDKLQSIVDFVNAYIVNFCNTSFAPVVVTGTKVTSVDGLSILLPEAPVSSIEEIRNLRYDVTSDFYVVDPTTYVLNSAEGEVETLESFPTQRLGIEVDFTYGHATVPKDLILSALEFVTYLDKREFTKSRNLGNGESADYGDPLAIPPYIRLAMNMYKVA